MKINTKKNQGSVEHTDSATQFKLNKASIEEMYKDDSGARTYAGGSLSSQAASIQTLTLDGLNSTYYSLSSLATVRDYSAQAYTFYPIYSTLINGLSNMFYWRYTYVPRIVKERAANANFEEIYELMSEVVDGLSLETMMPSLLAELLFTGALYLSSVKKNGSKTITTIRLPAKYCRPIAITQFGTNIFQFNYAYFSDLSLTQEQTQEVLKLYPPEMEEGYRLYQKDKQKNQWQTMNPKTSAAILLNKDGFPTYLQTLFGLKRYEEYSNNELARNQQQLDTILAHEMPTWEDKLVVEVPEMTALHKSMSKALNSNKHVRLMTTFGKMQVLHIGQDSSKENKTLENAFAAIFNTAGENSNLYSGTTKESMDYALRRNESIIWRYVQEIMAYYNLAVNNLYNFKGYQCDLTMLYLTPYNFSNSLLQYKEGATLGVSKLEYCVGMGIKQIDLRSKFEVEDFLKLDQLRPLSTSYTQGGQNAAGMVTEEPAEEDAPIEDSNNPQKPAEENPIEEQEGTNTEEVQNE